MVSSPTHDTFVTTGIANGGEAVGRGADGRVVFIAGALEGETVRVEFTEQKKRFARAVVVEVLAASPHRIEPECPEVSRGCGGCDFAHMSPEAQRAAKAQIVRDALSRVGRLTEYPEIAFGPTLANRGFRTTVRAAIIGDRAGFRKRRSRDVVFVETCQVSDPTVVELLTGAGFDAGSGAHGDSQGHAEVTIRVGRRTGERTISTDADPGEMIHETIAGHAFQISPASFFQTRPDGAEQLVELVRSAVERSGPVGTLVDLCGGVGLFAATVPADSVLLVESNPSAVADARVNVAHLGDRATCIASTFERWQPTDAEVVIADPSRDGLGATGVNNVAATGARLVVLVSCDAGSLGRDAALLVAAGYDLRRVTLVDMFPDTSHVEVVSEFWRIDVK